MIPLGLFLLQNIALPIVISLGVLWADQRWHGIQEYNRAFSRALSLGVDSKRHPDKVTLEALFMASEAELEYAAEQIGKDYKKVEVELKRQMDWWLFNDERIAETVDRWEPERGEDGPEGGGGVGIRRGR